ncbi:MAG: M20/M25/M40 family metallo-hydrolase, partial [Bacteroidota bacterium]
MSLIYFFGGWAKITVILSASLPLLMSSPPKALQHSAPKELFSAQRAYDHVRRVAQTPHSIGTPAHAKVRDYIMDECSRLKLQTGIQHTTATRTLGGRIMAGNIHNIIASIKGRVGEKAIVLMAHYDSQPHTPGAGDDGAGVAALLETARLLKESKPLKNDVILLFTDGEEVGLLGAQAFVTESKLLSKVALVINLEGRGNTGVSTMFEVNPENGWIMMEYANGAAYPMANSLSFEIYKKLPNDTDYSIFKEAGIAGLNHAFIEGFANYHSMTDTPDNLNLNSLQHHGENMVSLVKHFGNIDLVQTKGADRSYFNILGSWLVQYPGSWNFLFVVIGNVLTITILCTGLIKKRTHIKGVLAGFTFFPLLILLSSLIIMLFLKAIKWYYPLYNNFYAANSYNCYYYFFAIISLGIAIYVLPLAWVCKKFSIDSILTGILVVVTIILTALYQVAPTASYIVFLPLVSIGCAHLIVILKNLDYALQPRPYEALFFLGALPS